MIDFFEKRRKRRCTGNPTGAYTPWAQDEVKRNETGSGHMVLVRRG
jgi:hypothetical protein